MDGDVWADIKAAVDDMDVGVLVNNAGASHDPAHLHDIDPSAIDRVIAVNNSSVVKLTHLVLPGMVSRGRGAIVNVSTSFTTAIPAAPFLSLYTASKGFIDTFSKALSAEYSPLGIDVQVRSCLSSADLSRSSMLPFAMKLCLELFWDPHRRPRSSSVMIFKLICTTVSSLKMLNIAEAR